MIILSESDDEKEDIDNSEIELGSTLATPIDKLLKIKTLQFDLSLLH